jgi:ABC-type uncharacterized transport system auxiliary subunit
MDTTRSPHRPARPDGRPRRPRRILLAVVGLATALLAVGCDNAQQVPWDTYTTQLQQQIDAATATRNCAALRALLAAAKATSSQHEKATGFPNDALVSYIQASQHEAGCPAASS